MLRRGEGDRPRRGERGAPRRSRSRPDSNRHEAEGGVRAHYAYRVSRSIWSQGKPGTNLNLQHVVATHALVMHLIVSIVGVTSVLVLDKGEAIGR